MNGDSCPNVMPGAKCVDPECTYCRIAEAEQPKQKAPEPYDDKV